MNDRLFTEPEHFQHRSPPAAVNSVRAKEFPTRVVVQNLSWPSVVRENRVQPTLLRGLLHFRDAVQAASARENVQRTCAELWSNQVECRGRL